jgi:beta-glucosidase
VAATATPTVAVVIAGRPHGIDRVADAAAAVLYAWYPGPEGGQAIAELLLGGREPTGRLPVSLPRSSGVLPVAYNERMETTQSYVDGSAPARFPFGAGLGYTTWRLGCAELDRGAVVVALRNTGKRPGTQVVQLYGRHRVPGVQPRRAVLLGYRVITAAAGEECVVRIVPAAVPPGGELDVWTSITGACEPDRAVPYRSTR